jgi:hypothetical protein
LRKSRLCIPAIGAALQLVTGRERMLGGLRPLNTTGCAGSIID